MTITVPSSYRWISPLDGPDISDEDDCGVQFIDPYVEVDASLARLHFSDWLNRGIEFALAPVKYAPSP
jgi:hypothetical protein